MKNDSLTYDKLFTKIHSTSKTTHIQRKEIEACSRVVELKRGETLVDHLELNKCIYVVVEGALECNHKVESNTDNLVWFFFESSFDLILSMDSLYKNSKTRYKVIALEPSVVVKFELDEFEHLRDSFEAFNEFLKIKIIDWFFHYFEIRNNFLALSPIDFLDYLEANYPDVRNRISSQKLANFMGLTPEWLSKLKKRKQLESIA
ncbi:MAG: cyclic nucleotide-binding domain-containing protein [Bacteroidota bacterium]